MFGSRSFKFIDSSQAGIFRRDHLSGDLLLSCPNLSLNGILPCRSRRPPSHAFPREEALLIASLLALTGGYLDAYTWIVHRAFANAQTANLVFLWVYMTGGEWAKALHYVPPLFAFVLGVIMASCLRKFTPDRAPEISVADRDRLPVHYRDPA